LESRELTELLESVRRELSLSSSMDFFQWLEQRGFRCQYAYFRKLAKGEAIPSARVLEELAQACPEEFRQALVFAWCKAVLPAFSSLFPLNRPTQSKPAKIHSSPQASKQKTLSLKQVHQISASPAHYFLFLLLTLARTPLSQAEIRKKLMGLAPGADAAALLKDLAGADLAQVDDAGLHFAPRTDLRFPERTPALDAIYRRLDEWEDGLPRSPEFQVVNQRRMLRRVSPSAVALINQHLELIFATIRNAEEADDSRNTAVMHLAISLYEDRWPG